MNEVSGLLAIVLVMAAVPDAELPPGTLELNRIRQRIAPSLALTSNCTCRETITRSFRRRPSEPFRVRDVVRLDASWLRGREVFSWPGSHEFSDRNLEELVGTGTVADGDFVTHARNLFLNRVGVQRYVGEEQIRGRTALRYDFRVGILQSGWLVIAGGRSGSAAYHGSFWADAKTLDLLRIAVEADDIPPDVPVDWVREVIDYGRMRIGSNDVLMPQSSCVILKDTLGNENRNDTAFSLCREFRAESTLTFDAGRISDAQVPTNLSEQELPPGLRISIALDQPIDSSDAAEGDSITARLTDDVGSKREILAHKGDLLRGRVSRLEYYADPRPHFFVGLEFTEIVTPNGTLLFQGALQDTGIAGATVLMSDAHTSARIRQTAPNVLINRVETLSGLSGSTASNVQVFTPVQLAGVGTFVMEGTRIRIDAGTRLTWRSIREKNQTSSK